MSVRAISWAMRLPVKPSSKKFVLLCLADYSTDTGLTYPSLATMRDATGLGDDAIKSALESLCLDKIITDTLKRAGDQKDIVVYQLNPVKEADVKPKPKEKRPLKNEALAEADKIYEIFPRKVGRPKALTAIARCIKQYGFEVVMNGTKLFAEAWKASGRTDINFCAHPSTWFHQERFADDPAGWGLGKEVKAITGIPTYSQMMAHAKEKDSDTTFCAKLVTGFMHYWTKQKWQVNGATLDWKTELSNFIGRERAKAQ